ncbi:major facilitator superfamily domain-containing protein [Cercophora scortea]|uniref:Major facilitator superfamily domain-containing protein n=1 Tax=Cercophora scortea TaxID=314031 RepID=A0AAE0I7U8_9PEZI|nr:major facilitator superfamily domain-containing protein [Cercophora scortea]
MSVSEKSAEKSVLGASGSDRENALPESSSPAPAPKFGDPDFDVSALHDNVRKITGFRWFLICAGLYCSCLIYGLDTTIAADIQGAVTETYQNVPQLPWVGAGFSLGSVATIMPYNALFGKFNMKWLYIGGILLFEIGSALCGAAPTIEALIVGRVLAGAGGTGIYLGGLNHFSALCTREERGTFISGLSFCWGLGTILGPVVGGGFSQSSATWRWGFYINLIIGAIFAPIYLFYLPVIRPSTGEAVRPRLAKVDWVGGLLSCGMWVAFALAFISAGGIWGWNDGRTIATIVVFAVLFILYAIQQYFLIWTTMEDRSFPMHLLRSRTQLLCYIATSATITCMYVPTFYIPVYFQFVNNDSALMAAVRLLPLLLLSIAFTLGSGWALPKINVYASIYVFSGVLLTIAGALFYVFLKPSTDAANIYGFSIILGAGVGCTMQMGYAVASLSCKPADALNSLSLQNVSQIGSQVLCLVIAGRVFQSVAVDHLTVVLDGQGFTLADIQSIVAGAQSTLFQGLDGELKVQALEAITYALQTTFILVVVGGALVALCGLLMKWHKLFPGETTTEQEGIEA